MHYFASMCLRPRPPRRQRDPERPVPFNLCDGCHRESFTTVDNICLSCAQTVLQVRRAMFPRSEGDVYMRQRFGRAFRRSLHGKS